MIIQEVDKDGKNVYKYQEPSLKYKEAYFKDIINSFNDYAKSCDIAEENIEFDFRLINEINIRVDKRNDYYQIFHNIQLSEIREAALTAFWIIKFKPFLITSDKEESLNFNVNCGFAAYIILAAITEYVERKNPGSENKFAVSEEYMDKLKYALKYWDLCKESLMLLAETLCESALNEVKTE